MLSGKLSWSLALVEGAFLPTGLAGGGCWAAFPLLEFDLGPLFPQPPRFFSSGAEGFAYC